MSLHVLPVYVSSTWLDLGPERRAVEQAVSRLRETKFVGMEYFGSRDETTRQASLDDVDRSRAYICIVAARYGSGITEAEYDRATELGLPRFIYFKDDATVADELRDNEPEQLAKLDAFRRKLRANHLKGFDFKSPEDLAAKVTADLHRWLFDEYLTPKLQGALTGEVPREEAQALLSAVKDSSALDRDLVAGLRGANFNFSVGGNYAGRDNITNIYNAPAPAVSAPPVLTLHQLRAPVGDFVGREKEIGELLATLRGGGNAAITGISGMGGIGKTELALYVANKLSDVYPDAQLVVDMRGTDNPPRDPADALAACIRAFAGVEQRLPDDLQELTRIYRSVLEGSRALILLDNASDGPQARPLMPPAGSALLVTSRETIALPGLKRVTLEQLSPVESRDLLRGIVPRVSDDTADRICFLCGYLPLAIRAAGSLLDVTADLAPETYAEQLQDERRRLERIGAEGVDLGVEASFGLSYARLAPDAARLFRQLATFPATFDARAEEAVCEDPEHKHLSELLRRNLVRYNGETKRYSLHDLARLFADSRLNDDERYATHMRHAAYYFTVLRKCNAFYLKGSDAIKSGITLFDVERRNIEVGQGWAYQHSSRDNTAAQLCNKYPNAGADLLNMRQHPREIILWREAALAAARQLNDRAAEGWHLGTLGLAYSALGEQRRAIEYNEMYLAITREISDRRNEGVALGNLGIAYASLGETERAIDLFEQSLVITREIGDRRSEVSALGSLGNAYRDLGEVQHAVKYYEQALVVSREIGDRRSEGATLGNLGNVYIGSGETQRAIVFYEQRLAIAREIGDRRGEGIVLFNIGLALDKLGDRAKAITHVKAALEILEQIESPHAKEARAQLAEWREEA
jgi:tetratricopeptide (TPR) repeat protein